MHINKGLTANSALNPMRQPRAPLYTGSTADHASDTKPAHTASRHSNAFARKDDTMTHFQGFQGPQRLRRCLAGAALLGTLALPVFAQPAAPAAGPGADTPRAQRMHDRQERHEQHFAQRAAALKEALKLTPEQEPAWQDFMNAMQHKPQHARLDMNPDEFAKLSTPERLDRMRALRTQHIAEMDQRAEAIKAFYAKLSPQQQKTFDAQFMPRQGMMDPHDKHPGRAGMRGGPGPAR